MRPRTGATLAGLLLAAFALAPCLASAPAAVVEVLGRVFPGTDVGKDTLFLTAEQVERAERDSGLDLPSKIVTRFVATRAGGGGDEPLGFGYVDTHIVRTLPETLLIVVDPSGAVRSVEVLDFDEPQDYLPSDRWFDQFDGRELDADLQLKRSIRTLTGATLSSRAATDAVRRALAVHRAVEPAELTDEDEP